MLVAALGIVCAGIVIAYAVLIGVGLWRAATKYNGSAWWAGLVKLIVIGGAGRLAFTLFRMFR